MGRGQTELYGWVLAGEDALDQADSLPWKSGATSTGRVAGRVVGWAAKGFLGPSECGHVEPYLRGIREICEQSGSSSNNKK